MARSHAQVERRLRARGASEAELARVREVRAGWASEVQVYVGQLRDVRIDGERWLTADEQRELREQMVGDAA